MRLLRRSTTRKRVARPTTVRLPPGTRCFDVTAHPVGDRPKRVGESGLELLDVDRLRCPTYQVDHVGRTTRGVWVAFDITKVKG